MNCFLSVFTIFRFRVFIEYNWWWWQCNHRMKWCQCGCMMGTLLGANCRKSMELGRFICHGMIDLWFWNNGVYGVGVGWFMRALGANCKSNLLIGDLHYCWLLLLAVSGRGPAAWFIAKFAATLQQEELLCTGQLDTCSAYLLSLLGRRHYFGTCQVQSNRLTPKLLLKIF